MARWVRKQAVPYHVHRSTRNHDATAPVTSGYVRQMRAPLLFLSLSWTAPALAGDVRVVTSVPVQLELNGAPVVRTDAAGEVTLRDVEAGERSFVVKHPGGESLVAVRVPAVGEVRIEVSADAVKTDSPAALGLPDAAPPVVVFQSATAQRFSVVVAGARLGVAGGDAPLVLEGLGPGQHEVQIRSEDHLTIWARGVLSLQLGDRLELDCEEGRMVRATGRDGAWKAR